MFTVDAILQLKRAINSETKEKKRQCRQFLSKQVPWRGMTGYIGVYKQKPSEIKHQQKLSDGPLTEKVQRQWK